MFVNGFLNMELSSIEYAKLIAWLSLAKHNVTLGKTQLQKLLFIFYGLCLAEYNIVPFADDTPKAFPFGPVFPRPYKRYSGVVGNLTMEEKSKFIESPNLLKLATNVVDEFCRFSAMRLSEWSHREGSPWKKAVYRDGKPAWGREIDKSDIEDFFKRADWRIGL